MRNFYCSRCNKSHVFHLVVTPYAFSYWQSYEGCEKTLNITSGGPRLWNEKVLPGERSSSTQESLAQ